MRLETRLETRLKTRLQMRLETLLETRLDALDPSRGDVSRILKTHMGKLLRRRYLISSVFPKASRYES